MLFLYNKQLQWQYLAVSTSHAIYLRILSIISFLLLHLRFILYLLAPLYIAVFYTYLMHMFDQQTTKFYTEPSPTQSSRANELHLLQNYKQDHYISTFYQNADCSCQNFNYVQRSQNHPQFFNKEDNCQFSLQNAKNIWNNQMEFNKESYDQFSYFIWGKHQALRNITSFSQLFQSIKLKTSIQNINLCLDSKIPEKYKGAHFQLIDKQEIKLYEATILLIQYLFEMQKLSSINTVEQISIMILVPRMLVPVVMGKQGKIISQIKSITNCDINVRGPYRGYNYQNIQLTSKNINQLAKTCYLIYNTVYKALRKQSVNINKKILTDQRNCTISLLINYEVYKKSVCVYERLIQSIKKQNNIRIQVTSYPKQIGKLYQQNNQVVYKISGKMNGVKLAIASILNVIQFQSKQQKQQDLKLIINDHIAKSIKSLSGKILRDISSKSGYCFIEVKEKGQNLNKLVIKGNNQNKLKATYLTIQFICYLTQIIIMESKKQLIKYNEQISNFVDPFSFSNEENNTKNESQILPKQKKIKKKKSKSCKGKNKQSLSSFHGNINRSSNQRLINIIDNKENQSFSYSYPSAMY